MLTGLDDMAGVMAMTMLMVLMMMTTMTLVKLMKTTIDNS